MFKTTLTLVMAALCLNFSGKAQEPTKPPPLKKQAITAQTDSSKTKKDTINLKEVEIVSTGYQNIPKERATGSFTAIDTKTLNRSVGINIIDRLEGVTSGLLLNRGLATGSQGNNPKISIHGRSTIFANSEPLIVLNGFPYDGTIDQINPADIETIHILKDAAAASIWGSRSGNGVVVITTKAGRKNQKLTIGVNSALTVTDKIDLYYEPQISPAEFIDLEQFLFSKGFYNSRFSNPYNIVSSAVEIFNQRKNNTISKADSATRINALKTYDARKDLERYVYRNKAQQQHQVNLSGGTDNVAYYISGGYDKNLESQVSDSYDRITLNSNNTFSTLKDRLKLSADVNFITSNSSFNSGLFNPYSPYDRMADEFGNSLPAVKDYRMSYVDTAGKGKLLDWHYYPKEELDPVSNRQITQYRIKAGLNFKVIDELNLSLQYQYLYENTRGEVINTLQNYSVRDRVNKFSAIVGDMVTYVIPPADFFALNSNIFKSKIFRTQVNYNKVIAKDHEINAIAGYEGSDGRRNTNNQDFYGYDAETQNHINGTINPLNNYKLYYASGVQKISTAASLSNRINISQSYYANASYAYQGTYILSGSARRDESNLFGVKTNQKGVPLWSTGVAWNVHNAAFYKLDWLPSLKVRLTYGYNGNVDNSVSAYLTAGNAPLLNLNGNSVSRIVNPPNPDLRWEKVKTWNAGVDFTFKNNRLAGSIEAYRKNAVDLIGNNFIAFQSGITQYKGNGADLSTKGIDIVLNSRNLVHGFTWNTSLLFNYNTDKVIKYNIKQSSNSTIINNNNQNPLVGYTYNAVFSFPSAGLDAAGAPQGYLNGAVSKDYSKINSTLDPNQLIYHGSASPKYFGSIINTFGYGKFELSFNVIYKFDYFFRRTNVFSGSNFGVSSLIAYSLADYDKRWQKPGDELTTRIPALTYPAVSARNIFFSLTDDLIERGDHIRLQDARISYHLSGKGVLKSVFKRADVFAYARNLGILWKKNKVNIDPDIRSGAPLPLSGSVGINFTL